MPGEVAKLASAKRSLAIAQKQVGAAMLDAKRRRKSGCSKKSGCKRKGGKRKGSKSK